MQEYILAKDHHRRVDELLEANNRYLERARIAAGNSQARVAEWVRSRFGDWALHNMRERVQRVVEEALELAQAEGLSREEAIALVGYVYRREPGEAKQEAGGVAVCLLAYAEAAGFSMREAEADEIARIEAKPPEHFRARQNEKAQAGVAMAAGDEKPIDPRRKEQGEDRACSFCGRDHESVVTGSGDVFVDLEVERPKPAASISPALAADIRYLAGCAWLHADKFPVPSHVEALTRRIRLGIDGIVFPFDDPRQDTLLREVADRIIRGLIVHGFENDEAAARAIEGQRSSIEAVLARLPGAARL